jgi:hypothetical protein
VSRADAASPGNWWVLQRAPGGRFPFRLQIVKDGRPWLTLRVQDRWPAANHNLYCLREQHAPALGAGLEELERIPIIALQVYGKRLSVVLDRRTYRRCEFLFVSRSLKGQAAEEREQIFWVTEQSMKQRRSRARLVSTRASHDLTVRIASEERYPWRFPGATTERGRLSVGDYALVRDERIVAVVERKTFENLLAEFGVMSSFHQRLVDLAAVEQHALVIEAPYEDFLNPDKLSHWPAAFCARVLGEMYAVHPRLRVVFCSNRKTANEWTRNFFLAVAGLHERGAVHEAVRARAAASRIAPESDDSALAGVAEERKELWQSSP